MEENVKAKLSKILSGLGGANGKTGQISDFLKSNQGKKLIESLSEEDKKAIMRKFMSMDTKDIGERLKNFNSSAIGNITAEDIKKKLR